MFDPAQLAALAAVLRSGSFDLAAAALHVTPSAISQRIRALEERAGTILVIRSQPCTATEAGARLAAHADAVALLEQGLARDLGREVAAAHLRIAVNADSLATWVMPALVRCPDLLFEVVVDDQDHSDVLLRRGQVAGAVTSRAEPVQGCDSVALGALRYLATASPGFLARWCPQGCTPATLAAAPGLTFSTKDRLQADWLRLWAGRALPYRTHVLPSPQAFVEGALQGLGWGMNPEPLVRAHLASGALVALGEGLPMTVPLYWQASRMAAPALGGLTAALRAAARGVLEPPG
ncbi:MAG: hypothetical protein RLZZ528_1184 [Pseudomonadota bacterium]